MIVESEPPAVVVRVGPAPLDAETFAAITRAFPDFPPGTDFVLELSRLRMLDMRALRRTILLLKLSHTHRIRLHLVALSEPIQAMLRLCHLDRLFLLHADMDALHAWRAMHRSASSPRAVSLPEAC